MPTQATQARPSSGLIFVINGFQPNLDVFNDHLLPVKSIEIGFSGNGIDFNPLSGQTLFVSGRSGGIAEIDLEGTRIRTIETELPEGPGGIACAMGMVFDPAERAFWIVGWTRQTVYQIDLDGKILRSFPHPITRRFRAAVRGNNLIGGISRVPGLPGVLDLTAGSVFEGRAMRIIRVSRDGTELGGEVIPLDGLQQLARARFVGIHHRTRLDGTPTITAVALRNNSTSRLLELDPTLPRPRPVTHLRARQREGTSDVELTFRTDDAFDRILIDRDCQPYRGLTKEEFGSGATLFVDRDVPPGVHRYDVSGARGGKARTASAKVEVRVGPGAILERRFVYPARGVSQIARDPADGSFLIAGGNAFQSRDIYRLRSDFTLDRAIEGVVSSGSVTGMTVRTGGERDGQIYVIIGRFPEIRETFPLLVLTRDGELLEEHTLTPPRPVTTPFKKPRGLAWDEREQVFYYLEKNSSTIVRMNPEGETLSLVPHPFPPQQSHVANSGPTFDPVTRTLFLTTAGPLERSVTRAIQVSLDGELTGLEIPLAGPTVMHIGGIYMLGSDLLVGNSGTGSTSDEVLRVQAFPETPAPKFIRGDSNGDGQVDASDAVHLLAHLFLGHEAPECADAADADDSGVLAITDPVRILVWLFRGQAPIPPPYPEPGVDPSGDFLDCG